MKIWIDLTNSPHVNFFKPFIKKWKEKNFEIILTTRNLANTIELIEQNGWKYHEIGGHAGKNKVKKLLFFPKRIYLLRKFLKSYMPDIGISHSSFYSPLVCKLLGIPSIYLNDNEHAKGNLIAFKFSSLIILPEFLKEHAYQSGWSTKYNVDFYPGIKEGIYLSQLQIPHKKRDNPSSIKTIYIRLEPWTAQYYSGKSQFLDDLLIELAYKYELIILPRGTLQAKYYRKAEFSQIEIANKPKKLEEIYLNCDLFIGAGGSMTREIAFLGVPTISIYQDKLLEVDHYLVNNKFMFHIQNLTKKDVDKIIQSNCKQINKELKQKGKDAFNLINKRLEQYVKS